MLRIWFIDEKGMTFTHLMNASGAEQSVRTNPLRPYEFLIYEG